MADEKTEMRENKKKDVQEVAETVASPTGARCESVSFVSPEELRRIRSMRTEEPKVSLTTAIIVGIAACIITLALTLHAVNMCGLKGVIDAVDSVIPYNPNNAPTAVVCIVDMVMLIVLIAVIRWANAFTESFSQQDDNEFARGDADTDKPGQSAQDR